MGMYGYVEKVNFIKIDINRRAFNEIFRHCSYNKKNSAKEIYKSKITKKQFETASQVKQEFVRFTCKDWYMDVTIRKITATHVFLGTVIDYAKSHT